jgi:hypothetical protein
MTPPFQAGQRERLLVDGRSCHTGNHASLRVAERAPDGFICRSTSFGRETSWHEAGPIIRPVEHRLANRAHARIGGCLCGDFWADTGWIALGKSNAGEGHE